MLPHAKMRSLTLKASQRLLVPVASAATSYILRKSRSCQVVRDTSSLHEAMYRCWDGKNLDSPDHKSHVAYPTNGPALFSGTGTGGNCPSTHPVKIPQLMLEVSSPSPLRIPSSPLTPPRSSGTPPNSTTKPTGPPTAPSPSSCPQAIPRASGSTATTCLAGKTRACRKPWTTRKGVWARTAAR